MRRRVLISIALIVLLLAGGSALSMLLISLRPDPPDANQPRPALVVQAVKLAPRTITEIIAGYGTALADRYACVSSEVSGYVRDLADELRPGAEVHEGQVLVKLDDREYQEQLSRAMSLLAADEAQLEQLEVEKQNTQKLIDIAAIEVEITQREYDRLRALLEEGASGRREHDLTRLAYEQARRRLQTLQNELALCPQRYERQQANCELRRAEVALARLNVERCTITAPFDGRLDTVEVEIGEHASPGQQLLSLLDAELIDVPIELPVSRRGDVRVGTSCQLMLESRQGVVWRGTVARIDPSADETTRTFKLYLEVDNQTQTQPLVPGMFVRALIDGLTLKDVITVPRGCVQHGTVFVCRDGKAFRREVTVEHVLAMQAAVSGVQSGEIVITSNLDALVDGLPVELRLLTTALEPVQASDEPHAAARSPTGAAGQTTPKTP